MGLNPEPVDPLMPKMAPCPPVPVRLKSIEVMGLPVSVNVMSSE